MKPVRQTLCIAILLSIGIQPLSAAEDTRIMVKFPPMMEQHMLANMRDHLEALNEILSELSKGNADAAGKIAETRLGMSSLELHGAAHIAKFMPEGMAAAGTQMHHAASRFVIAAQNAELNPGKQAQRKVYKALGNITSACIACHQGYRVR